jgi:hypothetical protein
LRDPVSITLIFNILEETFMKLISSKTALSIAAVASLVNFEDLLYSNLPENVGIATPQAQGSYMEYRPVGDEVFSLSLVLLVLELRRRLTTKFRPCGSVGVVVVLWFDAGRGGTFQIW